jgi:ankyrin repeat protein
LNQTAAECCTLRCLLLSSTDRDGDDQASGCEHVTSSQQRPRQLSLLTSFSADESSPGSSESEFKLALHAAAFKGKGDLLAYLLAAGSEVNGTDCDGCTPLHLAVRRMHLSPSTSGGGGDDAWDEKAVSI